MKTKIAKTLLVSSVVIFALMLYLVVDVANAQTKKPLPPIKIGIVQSLSGMVSDYALEDLEGFRVKIDEVNAKGGVRTKEGRRKIELLVRDDMLKPDVAVKNA
ncbi:MAG: ABC transporter substrate-binding protein, partial [Deltaproteobacteria bacterium]|nr:ABC transporter substrate-binding protein [Deltaproteobacteria bacterium]